MKFGFDVDVISPVLMRKKIVSSTAIREFVSAGETSRAARRMGHPFVLTGRVQPGTGIGKRQVVPTLNRLRFVLKVSPMAAVSSVIALTE